MDKSQHNKLAQIFEQAAEQEAQANPLPEQLWQQIAQELTPPVEAANSIQQAFEEQELSALPPVDVWNNIAQGLGENKIKESFEKEVSPIAPEAVWDDIEKQLEIESVWKRVHQALDKHTNWLYWRKKAAQGSLLLLLLLWWKGCDQGKQPQPPIATAPIAVASPSAVVVPDVNNNRAEAKRSVDNTQDVSNRLVEASDNTKNSPNEKQGKVLDYSQNNTSQQLTEPRTTAGQTNQWAVAPPIPPSSKNSKAATAILPKATIQNFKGQELPMAKEEEASTELTVQEILPSTSISNIPVESAVAEKNTKAATVVVEEPINNNTTTFFQKNTTQQPQKSKEQVAITSLPTLQQWAISSQSVPALTTPKKVNNPSLIALEGIELEKVKQPKQRQKIRVEFGIQARVKGTMLLGNMTTAAMESNSMVKTKVLPTAAVGANLLGYFTKKDAFFVALHPMVNSRQYFGGFTEEGRYYHKEIKLSYFDAELGYHRTLFHYNDFGALPSTVYARVSYGFGYLNKGETILNGMLVDETEQYNKTNHSFGLALGNTHRLRNWIIDYGIHGQLGLSTIHLQEPTAYRHLLGVGAHLGLRYLL